jgi:putative ABC transport system permease protein
VALGVSVLVAGRVSAWIVARAPEPVAFDVMVDGRVLGYTSFLCAVAVMAFGLVPALRASRPDLAQVLRDGARGTDRRGSRLRTLLVGGQIALCTIVLATAALFTRSLLESRHADPGFPAHGVVDLALNVETRRLAPTVERALVERVAERARALPGVERTSVARTVPLGGSRMERGIAIEPRAGAEPQVRMTDFNVVGEGYFATLGIPLVRGREFGREERTGEPTGAVVNETFAARMWPGEEAIGRRVSIGGADGPWITVVGVARDIKYNALAEDPTPMLYLPWGQHGGGDVVLHVRATPARAVTIASELSRLLRDVDPLLPPVRAVPMEHDMGTALLMAQLGAGLLGGFGVLAMLLASVGIYGITTFAVAQRTKEIGIRIALGAARDDVIRLVAARTARPVVGGLVVGLALALGVSILLRAQLYGVGAGDPLALVGTAVAIAAVAALAAWAPVRRATRLDPSRALAAE